MITKMSDSLLCSFNSNQTKRQNIYRKVEESPYLENKVSTKKETQWLNIAQITYQKFLGKKSLGIHDQQILDKLQLSLESKNSINQLPNNLKLTVSKINQQSEKNITNLLKSLRVMIAATKYKTYNFTANNYKIPVNNFEIHKKLKENYSKQDFSNLMNLCIANGTFNLTINEDGFVKTTDTNTDEIYWMKHQWITDTIRCGDIQKTISPVTWKKALKGVIAYYDKQEAIFEKVINDPQYYHKNPKSVIAHLFDPKTYNRVDYNSRIESHGLALKALCDNLTDGLIRQKPWGFTQKDLDPESNRKIVKSITYLAKYLEIIDYPNAPSSGNWEAVLFRDGLTADTEAVRSGFESLKDLMFNKEYDHNISIQKIRQDLKTSKFGNLLSNSNKLNNLINKGYDKVVKRLFDSPNSPAESTIKPIDASLILLSESTINFDNSPNPLQKAINNAKKHLHLLSCYEKKILFPNGVKRYEPYFLISSTGEKKQVFDEYLYKDYENTLKNGHLEISPINYDIISINRFIAENFDVLGYPINPNDLKKITFDIMNNTNSFITKNNKRLEELKSNIKENFSYSNGIVTYNPEKIKLSLGNLFGVYENFYNSQTNNAQKKQFKKMSYPVDQKESDVCIADCNRPYKKEEAEWFLVSDMSTAYGLQLEKILDILLHHSHRLTLEDKSVINQLYQKEVEYINRSYARITADETDQNNLVMSNGNYCKPFKVPEAYEYVTSLWAISNTEESKKKAVALPGIDTPLAWATASLYKASRLYLLNLEKIDKLNISINSFNSNNEIESNTSSIFK